MKKADLSVCFFYFSPIFRRISPVVMPLSEKASSSFENGMMAWESSFIRL